MDRRFSVGLTIGFLASLAIAATMVVKVPSLSVANTNYVSEAIFTNGVTIGGVRKTAWPSGTGDAITANTMTNLSPVLGAGGVAIQTTNESGFRANIGLMNVNNSGDDAGVEESAGAGQTLSSSFNIFNYGDRAGQDQVLDLAYDVFNYGSRAGKAQILTNSYTIYNYGDFSGELQVLTGECYEIYNYGEDSGYVQTVQDSDNLYNFGLGGSHQAVTNSTDVWNIGQATGFRQIVNDSTYIFNLGSGAGYQQVITNSDYIFNYGRLSGANQALTNSSDIYQFGNNTGVSGDGLSHIFMLGTGSIGTNSNDYVFGDSAYNYKFPGSSMTVAGSILGQGGFKSSDGSAGITATLTNLISGVVTQRLTFKSGLLTSVTTL